MLQLNWSEIDKRDRVHIRTMLYVITILVLVILLTSEMSRELLISHVGQLLDIVPWIIIFGGLVVLLIVGLA